MTAISGPACQLNIEVLNNDYSNESSVLANFISMVENKAKAHTATYVGGRNIKVKIEMVFIEALSRRLLSAMIEDSSLISIFRLF